MTKPPPQPPQPVTPSGIAMGGDSMQWNHTGAWRHMQPRFANRLPPCHHACPAGTDIEALMSLVAAGHLAQAWRRLQENNPLTRVCSRVCFHPCEAACNRRTFDQPMAIQALERFVGEQAPAQQEAPSQRSASGKSVAVVGSGPAGLAAAAFLARLGHRVEIFEKMAEPGGMLRYGIPHHRLPRHVLDADIAAICRLGVRLRCNSPVGLAKSGADGPPLLSYTALAPFDAVFVAVGLQQSIPLKIPGGAAPQVHTGLDFLRRAATGAPPPVGKRAAVIGGGNTAIDVARVLRRHGAQVDIYYRRPLSLMPASAEEVDEAIREGVQIHDLLTPRSIDMDATGRVVGLTLEPVRSLVPSRESAALPAPAAAAHRVLADMVVTAIGAGVESGALPEPLALSPQGVVPVDAWGRTELPRFFAGGDVVAARAERNVVAAIGAGKRAAQAIDAYLRGVSQPSDEGDAARVVLPSEINRAYFTPAPRVRSLRLPVSERWHSSAEVEHSITAEQASLEAARCWHCGICTGCDNCRTFCPDVAISRDPLTGRYQVDERFCKGCGICVRECPRAAMELLPAHTGAGA